MSDLRQGTVHNSTYRYTGARLVAQFTLLSVRQDRNFNKLWAGPTVEDIHAAANAGSGEKLA